MYSGESLNHIYRSVWNASLGAMVAVAEISPACTGSDRAGGAVVGGRTAFGVKALSGLRALAAALAVAFSSVPWVAHANPAGGVAIVGQASMATSGNQLTVTTLNGAGANHSAINWQSFSIPQGNSTYFQQPTAASTVINRVVTNTPSQIFGTLGSNGSLLLVNQSGITVGAGAVVDTAGFTASALRMSDADALAGRLRFGDDAGSGAGVSVFGNILARSGDVVLLGSQVSTGQDALIQAPNGSTILAAGQQIEITGRGLEGITLQVQAPTDQAINLGTLQAGAVGMFAGTLRHSGEIKANTISQEGGKVVLKAAADTYVEGAGEILATGTVGGSVDVLGNRVAVMDQAVIDVSGEQGGGVVRVGGDYQGKNPEVQNANITYFGTDASIRADATANGDGGRVIVWADDATRAYGSVSARGGQQGGDGGFVETSGYRYLDANGVAVNTYAPSGQMGTWLLDPTNIYIAVDQAAATAAGMPGTNNSVDLSGPLTFQATGFTNDSLLRTGTLQNNLVNNSVVVSTASSGYGGGVISVVSPVSWSSSNSLTLNANGSININAPMTAQSATLNLNAGGGVNWSNSGFSLVNGFFIDLRSLIVNAGSSIYGSGNIRTTGAVDIRTSNGLIDFSNDGFAPISAGGKITLQASDDLVVNDLTSGARGDAVTLISTNGALDAQGPITTTNNKGRWLAYLMDSDTCDCSHNFGSLAPSFKQYNAPYGTRVLGSGNGVLYSNVVYLSGTLAGSVSKTYDGSTSINLAGASFGVIEGETDAWASNYYDDLSSATLVSGSGTLDNGNVGTGKMVTAQTVVVSGVNGIEGSNLKVYGFGFNSDYQLSGPIGIVTPAPVISSIDLFGSRVYDGTNIVNANIFSLSGLVNGETLGLTGSGTVADKNVGVNKPVSLGSLALTDGTGLASNYTFVGGTQVATITPAAITGVSGLTAVNKVYDGTTVATVNAASASLIGLFTGDNVTIFAANGISGVFSDKNVGQGKTVTFSGLTLGGTDAGNYTLASATVSALADISVRPLSTWLGTSGNWSDATNWDALPDASNVLAVVIPAGAAVTYDAAVGTTRLQTLTSSGSLTLAGGALDVSGILSSPQYTQTAGALNGAGSLTVNGSFGQSAGTIDMGGAVTITQSAGNLAVGQMSGASIQLTAPGGAITQTGALTTAGLLQAQSLSGSLFNDVGNRVSAFKAAASAAGNIALTNTGVLDVQGITTASGNITLNNIGGISTSGLVKALNGTLSMTANSPLTIGASGVSSTGDITLAATNQTSAGNMTLDGSVTSTAGSINMSAANNFVQNAAVSAAGSVTASAGGSITFGPGATTAGNPVLYSAGGVPVTSPPSPAATATQTQLTETIIRIVDFSVNFEQTLLPLVFKDELLVSEIATNVANEITVPGLAGEAPEQDKFILVLEGSICTP